MKALKAWSMVALAAFAAAFLLAPQPVETRVPSAARALLALERMLA